ncbi:MAG: L,D-transpeptidase family protein [bacterium]|nr:L,D-transpeptidase family protein [bacterium]
MKKITAFLLLTLLLFACSESEKSKEEIQSFEHQNIPLSEKIKKATESDYLNSIGVPKTAHNFVRSYYKQRGFKSRWSEGKTLTKEGKALKEAISNKITLGVPETRFEYGKTKNFIQDEIWLTASTAMVLNDIESGIIDFKEKRKKKLACVSPADFDKKVKFDSETQIREQFIALGPKDSTYQVLGLGLIDFVDKYPLDTSTFNIRSVKYDSTEAVNKTRLALISKGYFPADVKDTTGVLDSLKTFQVHNGLKPDGVIGKYTSKALNESSYHKVERILLAMDKIRSDREYPKKYIRINIPEYKLRLYINDSLKSDHNIVVGKYENQTPQLESKLRKIVVYPYWNVPYSISSKEILPALKYNSAYLGKHNYKIYKSGEEVDPSTVDWKSIRQNAFPYKVVQDPGRANSLGVIKFDFYNEHSVYFHDTPSKGLFGADVRAYSHGCMRTQHPVDLAKVILHRDSTRYGGNEMIPDSLDSILSRKTDFNYHIKLLDPIPIYIDYVTVARQKDRMVVHVDIYGRDEEYLKIMRQKS